MAIAPFQSPEFKYITGECLQEWKSGANPAFRLADPVPMTRFLYELVWAMVRGDLPFQKCKAVIDSVTFSDERERDQLGSVLADIIAHLGQDPTISGDYRSRLVRTTKTFVEFSFVPPRLLQESCEEDFLWDSEFSKLKSQDLKSKEVRVNTRLLYQQTKFNLLREESEGYAKLATLLCQAGLDSSTSTSSVGTINLVKSLIGHFDLDPNRVFDIVLDCFELCPENNIFYDLIPMFPKSHAVHVLGFKFQYYQQSEVNTPTPFGLFRLAALLVKAELVDLDTIYSHLLPSDMEAFEHYASYVAQRIDEANKIGKINLAATGKDLMEEEKQDIAVDLYTVLDSEDDTLSGRAFEIDKNQKLGLLSGFLSVDDWRHAQVLFERLFPLNPVEIQQISDGLFRMIGNVISRPYALVSQTYDQKPGKSDPDSVEEAPSVLNSFVNLPSELFQMLSVAGPYLHRDTVLLQKVCRVLKAYYQLSHESCSTSSVLSPKLNELRASSPEMLKAKVRTEEALGSCLLPSLQLIPANPAIGMEIWNVLSLLPYEVRYRLYGEWEKDTELNPLVLTARQIAKLDTRRILKRLSKENFKQLGRVVGKLAHANPLTVLRTIIQQIEAYRDMITPIVDAFKYLTQMEYDILEYVVMERLAQGGREKLKDDGLNLSDWLQLLASFCGNLCKKHTSMELKGLFQYLVNQLKKGVGVELVVLEEIIQQMANIQYTENLTEEQIDCMAGSDVLRNQATLYGTPRNIKVLSKSINKLKDSLLPNEEPKLAIPLLLLIAQYRSMIIINADAPTKMVGVQFDRCHGILLQYTEFLSSAITPLASYAEIVPSLEDLVHKYHLEPEVAFHIYRPLMRLFKSKVGDSHWPLNVVDEPESSGLASLQLDLPQISVTWSDLLNTCRSMLPARAWNSLSPDIYATFWGLTLYDIHVPKNRYESEIAKLHAALRTLEENSDNSSVAIAKRKKDKEKTHDLIERLTGDLEKHEQHVASVLRRLRSEKEHWLTSCPDVLKINMEFLQRCIFPRCVVSMPDAVYCAMFVHLLYSMATPYFNIVNHIDVLICKTLQPMICCCTEYEAGRLGRFLYETLKMAYRWKNDRSLYERECVNMPGFAVYYRDLHSLHVSYSQFVKVHCKWSSKISKSLGQCLESTDYTEIRNSLIVLAKMSGVFPVMRKSGIVLEKRVSKIKMDEREDLKVLATGVAAALASRKSAWVSEEEFSLGLIDPRPVSVRPSPAGNGSVDSTNVRTRPNDSDVDKLTSKMETQQKESGISADGAASVKSLAAVRGTDEPAKVPDDLTGKAHSKPLVEQEMKTQTRRTTQSSTVKVPKQDNREDAKKVVGRSTNPQALLLDKESVQTRESSQPHSGVIKSSGSSAKSIVTATAISSKTENGSTKPMNESVDLHDGASRVQRGTAVERQEKASKRRKSDSENKDSESADLRNLERDKAMDVHLADRSRTSENDKNAGEVKPKDKSDDKHDKEHGGKPDRYDKIHGEDNLEKPSEKSTERRERSVEKNQERGMDRHNDKSREERTKARHQESSSDRTQPEERHGHGLPPPPPLPSSFVPESVSASRRDEEADRRVAFPRHMQRLSPRHDEKGRRQSENFSVPLEDNKRRRPDDGSSNKADDKDKDKGILLKEDADATAASKKRKFKKDSDGGGDFSPVGAQSYGMSAFPTNELRDRGKSLVTHRVAHVDDFSKVHSKDMSGKSTHRESEQVSDRDWEEEKRLRAEAKRKHRK